MDDEAADQEWLSAADGAIVEEMPAEAPAEQPDEAGVEPPRQLDWWHRDHPTFFALTGFFSGLVLAAVLPAIFFVPGYLFGVLPAFGGNSGGSGRTRSNVDEFRRR